ncbi:hypothetical protein ANTRET_LOCUS8617 [Anthophora retusa]
MDASTLERRYLKINKKLGMLTGVWPYQKHSTKWISRSIVICLVLPTYLTQYARLIVYPRMDIVLNDYPYLIVGFGIFVKFGNYFINESKLTSLVGKIYEDWQNITSTDEYKIMLKYAERGVLSVILYTLHISLCVFLFICLPYVPPILDMVLPLNETREPLLIYPAYYGIDEKEYHSWILAHMTVMVSILCCVFCACDANYVYAVQHACGLLAVTEYRFQCACREVITQNENEFVEAMKQMYKNVSHSIQGHQRAVQSVLNITDGKYHAAKNFSVCRYVREITVAHDICMFITVGLLMISISASLLQIAEHEHDAMWLTNCMFFVAQLFHMLFLVIQGQFVLDSYDNLYSTICESTWYNSSCRTQALYILALRSSQSPPLLTAGGFITLNLKTFAEVTCRLLRNYLDLFKHFIPFTQDIPHFR